MSAFSLLRIAFKALFRNRMRTFLSVLGIVIGAAAVIIGYICPVDLNNLNHSRMRFDALKYCDIFL